MMKRTALAAIASAALRLSACGRPAAQGTVTGWNQVNPAWPDQPIAQTGYIPFPASVYDQATQRLNNGQTGTVFGGSSSSGAKIEDLFTRPLVVP